MTRDRSIRAGLSLIELLVVVSIVSLLLGLTLPAVQSAREAARRSQCANNLKQIGLAMASYESVHACYPYQIYHYPPGFQHAPCPPERQGFGPQCISVLMRLSPYMDERAVFDAFNFSIEACPGDTYPSPENATAGNVRIATLVCPSDGPASRSSSPSSYRGNVGVGPSWARTAEAPDSGNGFFPWYGPARPSLVLDGLSHTVSFAERLVGTLSVTEKNPERDFGNLTPVVRASMHTADEALDACRLVSASPDFPRVNYGGHRWYIGGRDQTFYTHAQEPNGTIPDALDLQSTPPRGIVTARSMHPGGVNVLMGDGATRFVSEGIQRRVWRGLGTRDGRELVE
jgi:prepilin-type N-terminal cleavage/methylation domain-containing protein/prepilin-type processing-associated H-X9-DG protein